MSPALAKRLAILEELGDLVDMSDTMVRKNAGVLMRLIETAEDDRRVMDRRDLDHIHNLKMAAMSRRKGDRRVVSRRLVDSLLGQAKAKGIRL